MLKLPDSWVWDSWYVFDGKQYHAFYLRASRALGNPDRRHRHVFVGHAISDDLTNWTTVADAIAVSDSPAFDSWTTWTGSVVQADDGTWWMYYTGTSREDGGDIQSVGAATSKDLMTWTKVSSEAMVKADPAWYETLDLSIWHDQAWRDPWVFRGDDGQWHMFITARAAEGEAFDRGVLGHATSADMRNWTVQPPLTDAGAGWGQMEVFQVEVVDGVPTLLWCCGYRELSDAAKAKFGRGGMFSATGETVLGPFDLENATRFPHDSIYAARIVKRGDDWFMLGFRDIEANGFVGEITDPIPVTSVTGVGLVPVTEERVTATA